jgi:hypothetical protein
VLFSGGVFTHAAGGALDPHAATSASSHTPRMRNRATLRETRRHFPS